MISLSLTTNIFNPMDLSRDELEMELKSKSIDHDWAGDDAIVMYFEQMGDLTEFSKFLAKYTD